MKIYFTDITFNNSPLIWDFNEKTNIVVCTFCTLEQRLGEDCFAVLKELREKNYDGISINEKTAAIDDLVSFKEKHQSITYMPKTSVTIPTLNFAPEVIERPEDRSPSKPESSSKKTPYNVLSPRNSDGKKGGFAVPLPSKNKKNNTLTNYEAEKKTHEKETCPRISSNSVLGESKSDEFPRADTRYSPRMFESAREPSFESILLEHLFTRSEHPGLWADIMACKDYFNGKTNEDRTHRVVTCLRTDSSYVKELQYLLNDELYPVKGEVIILLEKLFEQEFHPAYLKWRKEQGTQIESEMLTKLFKYLRHAILNVMLNERFNKEPTEYEKLSEYDRTMKFGGNDKLYHDANHRVRKERAQLMLMDLAILVDELYSFDYSSVQSLPVETIPMQAPVKERKAVKVLESFKAHLMSQPDLVKNVNAFFEKIQAVLIKSGELEREHQSKMGALELEFANKLKTKDGYFSLYHMAKEYLSNANETLKKKKNSVTPEVCEQLAQTITSNVIAMIVDDIHAEVMSKREGRNYESIFNKIPIAKPLRHDLDIYLNSDWIDAAKTYTKEAKWIEVIKEKGAKGNEIDKISKKIYEVIKMKAGILQMQISSQEGTLASTSETGDSNDFTTKVGFY